MMAGLLGCWATTYEDAHHITRKILRDGIRDDYYGITACMLNLTPTSRDGLLLALSGKRV